MYPVRKTIIHILEITLLSNNNQIKEAEIEYQNTNHYIQNIRQMRAVPVILDNINQGAIFSVRVNR